MTQTNRIQGSFIAFLIDDDIDNIKNQDSKENGKSTLAQLFVRLPSSRKSTAFTLF